MFLLHNMTQNSGIAFPCIDGFVYYGILDDVIGVRYQMREEPYYLFKCTWYDSTTRTGTTIDAYGLTSVNTRRTAWSSQPYIWPSQAQQAFYSNDMKRSGWQVVNRWTPRDAYNVPEVVLRPEDIFGLTDDSNDQEHDLDLELTRNDIEPVEVSVNGVNKSKKQKHSIRGIPCKGLRLSRRRTAASIYHSSRMSPSSAS